MITPEQGLAARLNQLIDDNLSNPEFSTNMICQELGLSRSQLHRYSKEQTQLSVTLFIRQRRLKKAQELLVSSSLRISEIADLVGISNPQNFSKYFTEAFAVSPTEFRRLQHLQEVESLKVEASLPAVDLPKAIGVPVSVPPLHPEKQAETRPLPWGISRWPLYSVILVGLILGLSMHYSHTYVQSATRPADAIVTSLAVLPLINMGPPDTDPICEGLMDDIHAGVSLIRHLRVTARASSDHYRNAQKNIWQISEDLRVANILRGKMLKTGEQIQMKIELIDAKEDRLIWVKTYSVAYRDVFQLTEQITKDVARELKLENNPTSVEKLAMARTKNMVAYNDFLQGRQLIITRNKDKMLEGIAKFDQALALDSTFAEAYAFKGVAYSLLANLDYVADPAKAYQLAQQYALKAIRTDPTNSTAYGVLGTIYADTYQWQAAETSFRISLQYNPNDAQINYWYSLLLRSTGQLNEAIRYSTEAVVLDPLYPVILTGHVLNCAYGNRFDLAQASLSSGRALFGDLFIFHIGQGFFYLARSNYKAAAASFARALAINPQYTGIIPTLMYCEAKGGNRTKALTYLPTLTATTPRTYYDKAVVFAGLSQKDSCLYYLKAAADGGHIYKDMKVSPLFRAYHTEPVFQAILRQYRLPVNR